MTQPHYDLKDGQEGALNAEFHGYGRAWTEKKATGCARFFQMMREPATTTSYYVAFGVVMLGCGIGVAIVAWMAS